MSLFPNEEAKKATEKAMALLLHKDRTGRELSDRLKKAGFSGEASEYAMAYVESYGYIDDARYAERYTDYHKSSQSKSEIRRKLSEKGISDEILSDTFAACYDGEEGDSETEALQALLAKRLKGREVSELTFEEKQKQMRYLAGKGYPIDKIRKLML